MFQWQALLKKNYPENRSIWQLNFQAWLSLTNHWCVLKEWPSHAIHSYEVIRERGSTLLNLWMGFTCSPYRTTQQYSELIYEEICLANALGTFLCLVGYSWNAPGPRTCWSCGQKGTRNCKLIKWGLLGQPWTQKATLDGEQTNLDLNYGQVDN